MYSLVKEIEHLKGDVNGLTNEVQTLKEEKTDLMDENEKLQIKFEQELNVLSEDLEESQKRASDLVKKNEETEQKMDEIIESSKKHSFPDEASIYILKDMGIEDYSILTDSLTDLGQDIIGFDGVLGGTMHFTKVVVLNDRWVFGRFEDGHYGGYGIYGFEVREEEIVWRVVTEYSDN